LAGFQASVQNVIAQDEQKAVEQNATGREEARADIELNPGYRL
jgi:hypothetical protein